MPSTRDYMRLDDEIDLRSEDSLRLKTRKDSNATSPQGIRDFAAADYWFGKRYFECVLAQDTFICLGRDKEAATIDVCHFLLTICLLCLLATYRDSSRRWFEIIRTAKPSNGSDCTTQPCSTLR